jgi:serine/threonine protein kinase
MMELLGIPLPEMIDQSRKKEQYFDTDYSPFLIEHPELGILSIPESRSIEKTVPVSDPDFINFILRCLDLNPKTRFSAREAMKHPFITKQKPDTTK